MDTVGRHDQGHRQTESKGEMNPERKRSLKKASSSKANAGSFLDSHFGHTLASY